jgi:TRAP-type C4-dicarboxylate transport system substrate-binding protein
MLRDFNHWKSYRDSKLFRDIAKGYEDKTKHKVNALTYYGERMVTANKEIKKPEDMKGMKLRVPPAPLYLMLAKSVGANATPIAFAEVYLACSRAPSTARRTRCRPSWPRSSTRCRATSC